MLQVKDFLDRTLALMRRYGGPFDPWNWRMKQIRIILSKCFNLCLQKSMSSSRIDGLSVECLVEGQRELQPHATDTEENKKLQINVYRVCKRYIIETL